MTRAFGVTLRLHRFEVAIAGVATIGLGLWATSLIARLALLDVPRACLDAWSAVGSQLPPECSGPVRAWGSMLEAEAPGIVNAMSILAFAVGLLGGVPIIARELEGRTAQTAWSLDGSRHRWLARQMAPIVLLLGAALAFSGLAVGVVEGQREIWGEAAFLHVGEHGPAVLAPAFAAFGIGLLVGGLLGRTLPAFVVGIILCYGIAQAGDIAREAWLASLPSQVISETVDHVQTGWAWRDPKGLLITESEAFAQVPAEVAARDAGLGQAINALQWLEGRGFTEVTLGVSEEIALRWAWYEAGIFILLGLLTTGATAAVLSRRRPF